MLIPSLARHGSHESRESRGLQEVDVATAYRGNDLGQDIERGQVNCVPMYLGSTTAQHIGCLLAKDLKSLGMTKYDVKGLAHPSKGISCPATCAVSTIIPHPYRVRPPP